MASRLVSLADDFVVEDIFSWHKGEPVRPGASYLVYVRASDDTPRNNFAYLAERVCFHWEGPEVKNPETECATPHPRIEVHEHVPDRDSEINLRLKDPC